MQFLYRNIHSSYCFHRRVASYLKCCINAGVIILLQQWLCVC